MSGRVSGCDKNNKNNLVQDVRRILNLDTKVNGRGIEKIFFPSSTIDISTRLEILLGLKLSRQTDTLTEARNLFDELYKRGEKQKEQNRKAFDKNVTQ